MSDRETIGFIGLGKMGIPMARRLTGAGHTVLGCDHSPEATAAAVQQVEGARAATLADIGRACRTVILMLPDSNKVDAVVFGQGGLAAAMNRGSIVLDMSSSDPNRTLDVGKRLATAGIRLVDAPVSGGVKKAIDGTLSIMAGGEAADIESVRPILSLIGTAIACTGPLGSAHAMKALNNYVSATGLLVACEALNIGTSFGLAAQTIIDVLNASSGRNNSTENKLGQFVVSRKFNSGFSVGLMRKDLSIALALAKNLNARSVIGDSVLQAWSEAEASLGAGADHTEIGRILERGQEGMPVK